MKTVAPWILIVPALCLVQFLGSSQGFPSRETREIPFSEIPFVEAKDDDDDDEDEAEEVGKVDLIMMVSIVI